MIKAIYNQSAQVTAGVIGGLPSVPDTDLQLSVSVQGRLKTEQEFGDIILKSSPSDAAAYLHDVVRTKPATSEYSLYSLLGNRQTVTTPIFQAPGSDALQIPNDVRRTMVELKRDSPENVDYHIVYDST